MLNSFDILASTATSLQALFQGGLINSVELATQCLRQIQAHNTAGLQLRGLIDVAPAEKILSQAALLDQERSQGRVRGPLHGVPVVIKDSISTNANLGMRTTAGSWALDTCRVTHQSAVVDRLHEAGLIIMGKASLTEFNNWKGAGLIDGWSPRGGQSLSPYVKGGIKDGDLAMGHSTPGGSSSGSAISVASGFSILSVALETDGSIVSPASRAALYAMKPTPGKVTLQGILPVTRSFDSVGAMARSATDLADLTYVLFDPSEQVKLSGNGFRDFMNGSWEGLRIGFLDPAVWKLPESLCAPSEEANSQMRSEYFAAIDRIRKAGARVEYPVALPKPLWDLMGSIMTHEFGVEINRFLQQLEYCEVRTLAELVDWNNAHAEIELPKEYPSQQRLLDSLNDQTSEETNQKTVAELRTRTREEGIDSVLERLDLDALAILTDSPLSSVAAGAGYPIATMPMGSLKLNGRPFGMSVIAKEEETLFRIMSAWEQTNPSRLTPHLLRTEESGRL